MTEAIFFVLGWAGFILLFGVLPTWMLYSYVRWLGGGKK